MVSCNWTRVDRHVAPSSESWLLSTIPTPGNKELTIVQEVTALSSSARREGFQVNTEVESVFEHKCCSALLLIDDVSVAGNYSQVGNISWVVALETSSQSFNLKSSVCGGLRGWDICNFQIGWVRLVYDPIVESIEHCDLLCAIHVHTIGVEVDKAPLHLARMRVSARLCTFSVLHGEGQIDIFASGDVDATKVASDTVHERAIRDIL